MNKILEIWFGLVFAFVFLFSFLLLFVWGFLFWHYFSIWVVETKLRIRVLTVSYQVFSQSRVLQKEQEMFFITIIKYSIAQDFWWLSDMTIFFFLFFLPIYLFLLVVHTVELQTPVRALHSLHLGNTDILFDTSSMTYLYAPSIWFFFASPIHFRK